MSPYMVDLCKDEWKITANSLSLPTVLGCQSWTQVTPNWSQIGQIWDSLKSVNCFQYIHVPKCTRKLIFKSPRFIPFTANQNQIVTNSDIQQQSLSEVGEIIERLGEFTEFLQEKTTSNNDLLPNTEQRKSANILKVWVNKALVRQTKNSLFQGEKRRDKTGKRRLFIAFRLELLPHWKRRRLKDHAIGTLTVLL